MNTNQTTNIYYVYKHTFSNGSVYIGKGKNKRAYNFHKRNKMWNNHYAKYGAPIIELCFVELDEDLAFLIEVELISKYKESAVKLINMTTGGEGASGLPMDILKKRNEAIKRTHNKDEIKLKVSLASKKIHADIKIKEKHRAAVIKAQNTPEAKALKSKNAKGRIQTIETREKRSASMRGRKLSEDHVKNISGINHHRIDTREFKYIHPIIGEVIATQSYMLKEYNCKASHLILGKIKSSKGWKLYDN